MSYILDDDNIVYTCTQKTGESVWYMTQKIIILNKNYANNSIYKETNALNTLIVGKNTVGTNIEIGKAYNKH